MWTWVEVAALALIVALVISGMVGFTLAGVYRVEARRAHRMAMDARMLANYWARKAQEKQESAPAPSPSPERTERERRINEWLAEALRGPGDVAGPEV